MLESKPQHRGRSLIQTVKDGATGVIAEGDPIANAAGGNRLTELEQQPVQPKGLTRGSRGRGSSDPLRPGRVEQTKLGVQLNAVRGGVRAEQSYLKGCAVGLDPGQGEGDPIRRPQIRRRDDRNGLVGGGGAGDFKVQSVLAAVVFGPHANRERLGRVDQCPGDRGEQFDRWGRSVEDGEMHGSLGLAAKRVAGDREEVHRQTRGRLGGNVEA